MDETHRFLRYVMPGASFSIEAFLLLWVLLPRCTFTHLLGQLANANLGGALAAFLGLGGLGFLFSIFHHWSRECPALGGVDNRPVIARLRDRNVLQLFDACNGEFLEVKEKPNRHEAWTIVNALWHQRVSKDHRIKGANRRAETLADIVHSIGTARWGALFALLVPLVAIYYVAEPLPDLRLFVAFGLAVIILFVHHSAYRRTSRTAEDLIAEILEDTLTESFWDSGKPVRTFVALQRKELGCFRELKKKLCDKFKIKVIKD